MTKGHVRFYLVRHEQAKAAGFSPDSFTVWCDIVIGWLFSVGIKDCVIGSEHVGQSFGQKLVGIYLEFDIPDDLRLADADETIIADMVMAQDAGVVGPLALERQNPYITKPLIASFMRERAVWRDRISSVAQKAAALAKATAPWGMG